MKVTGTVEYVDLEGGLFRLTADDGKRYTLLGARGDLKAAKGARVEVEGSLDEGFGIAMSGPQLRVQKLRKL
jgi:formylmethanofuran dehydrogenase subunit C